MVAYGSGRLVVVRELDRVGEGGVQAFVFRGHNAHVTCAKFSESGAYVASGDVRGGLKIWSYDNEEHLCKLDLKGALTGPIRDISWDGDNKRICIVGEAASTSASEGSLCARVFQWDTAVTCGDLGQHMFNRCSTVAFRKKRPMRIVTGGGDDHLLTLNGKIPFAKMKDVRSHAKGGVNGVRYSYGGDRIVSVGADRRVVFYEGKDLEVEKVMEDVHDGSIYAVAWSFDDRFVLTCGADGCTKVIDPKEGVVVHTWDVTSVQHGLSKSLLSVDDCSVKKSHGSLQLGCAFIAGCVPLSVSFNGHIAIFPSMSSNLDDKPRFLTGHQAPVSTLAADASSPSPTIYTADSDGVICAWNMATGDCSRIARNGECTEEEIAENTTLLGKVHSGAITAVAFVEGDLVSVGWDDVIRVTHNGICDIKIPLESQPNVLASGTSLVVVVTVAGVLLYQNRKLVSDLIQLDYAVLSACVSRDDNTVVLGGDDKGIYIFQVLRNDDDGTMTLKNKHSINNGHLRPIHAVQFSPDTKYLASADARDICVWDVTSDYAPVISKNRWCFHSQKITSLVWSPDASVLASGSLDDSIYLWSVSKKMRRLHYPFAHRGGVTGLYFTRDGGKLISSGADGCVCEWNVRDDINSKFN